MTLQEYIARALCKADNVDPDEQVLRRPFEVGPHGSAVVRGTVPAWALRNIDAYYAAIAVEEWQANPEIRALPGALK